MGNVLQKAMAEKYSKPVTNADILNTVRALCSEDYKTDIPEMQRLSPINHATVPYANYTTHQNEFFNVLINRIGTQTIKALMFEHPLGVFRTDNFIHGETLEELYVHLADRQDFDAKSTISPFRYADTNITAFYHDKNREDLYERTMEESWTIKAFTSDNGFDSFINKLFVSLLSSDEVDEFTIIKQVITDSLTPVNVAPGGATPSYVQSPATLIDMSVSDWLVTFNKELIKRSSLMAVPSKTRFENGAQVPNATPVDEQFLLCSAEFSAELDSLLANAFNMDKASVLAHKIVLDDFPTYTGTGTYNGAKPVCALLSKDSLILKDTKVQMTNIWNPRTLSYNYFLHHHGLISFSLIENSRIYYTL